MELEGWKTGPVNFLSDQIASQDVNTCVNAREERILRETR